jgi:hypothetical protein
MCDVFLATKVISSENPMYIIRVPKIRTVRSKVDCPFFGYLGTTFVIFSCMGPARLTSLMVQTKSVSTHKPCALSFLLSKCYWYITQLLLVGRWLVGKLNRIDFYVPQVHDIIFWKTLRPFRYFVHGCGSGHIWGSGTNTTVSMRKPLLGPRNLTKHCKVSTGAGHIPGSTVASHFETGAVDCGVLQRTVQMTTRLILYTLENAHRRVPRGFCVFFVADESETETRFVLLLISRSKL